jgi:hypothetical protein
MTPDRWDEVEKRLHDAVQLAPADRAGFLNQIQDLDVRLEVGSLLAAGVARDSLREVVRRAALEITSPSPVGSSLDHFQILQAIGHGGMGDVYLARDLKLGRQLPSSCCRQTFNKTPNTCVFSSARRVLPPH